MKTTLLTIGSMALLACGTSGGEATVDTGGESSSASSASTVDTTASSDGGTVSSSAGSTASTAADSDGGSGNSSSGSDEGTTTSATETGEVEQPMEFLAVTFNTGGHADGEDQTADEYYGNGLSWIPAVEQTRMYFEALQPDIVVFQELFHSPDCADIPVEYHAGYVCETWSPGDPTVVQVVMGSDYQVACHLGKTDKCAAVKKSFGTFAGCDGDFCLDGLDGAQVEDCGSGSRVGRGNIELAAGGSLTIVNFHGTSGVLPADQFCRVAQVEQVFVDLDGAPAANGERNLVLGDFNTDPARAALADFSAARWNDFVGDGRAFHFITAVGSNVQPTYAGLLNIDHQVSDSFVGDCWHPGITAGYDAVVDFDYFDHVPAVCTLAARSR